MDQHIFYNLNRRASTYEDYGSTIYIFEAYKAPELGMVQSGFHTAETTVIQNFNAFIVS